MDLCDYKEPNILFLKGCFLDECESIEDVFDDRLYENIKIENEKITYDKIPHTFTSVSEWPTSNNIKCWYCDCDFHTVPVFIPNTIYEDGVMDVFGNFCSFNCCCTYIDVHSDSKRWEKKRSLRMLYEVMKGSTIDDITPSPSKYNMQQYGGDIKQSEYIKTVKSLNVFYVDALKNNKMRTISM